MAKPVSKFVLAVAVGLLTCTAGYAQTAAGFIKNNEGGVEIVRGGKSIPATAGTQLMAGDVLKTSKDSSAGVVLKDDTRIAVGSNSQVALDKFAFNPNTNQGNMVVSIVKGSFAMISGLLVKANPASTTIKTPTATAGVRGTYFLVEVP